MSRFGLAVTAVAAAAVVTATLLVPSAAPPALAAASAASGSTFTPVSPVRVLDTRVSGGPVRAGSSLLLDLSARVPASATAVVLNVTGTEPTTSTHVTVWPDGAARPTASNLNLVRGETRPNLVTVSVSEGRRVRFHNNAGSVHLIADLAGYYGSGAGSRYTPFLPQRALDTRDGTGMKDAENPDGSISLDLAGRVPESATAVTFNLTATNVTAATYVVAWPHGSRRPTASNLNVVPGETRPNLVTVAIGADRKVDLWNRAGSIDLIADLAGFYSPDAGVPFFPTTPVRMVDTRTTKTPATAASPVDLGFGDRVPANTTAYVLNVTATEASLPTFVSAVPRSFNHRSVSNLNVGAGQTAPNLVTVAAGHRGALTIGPGAGRVHVIADLAGYFAPAPDTCAAGCVRSWGNRDSGLLGAGGGLIGAGTDHSARPGAVLGLSGVTAVAGRYALRADGTVWAWGPNQDGQLGNGWAVAEGYAPVPVPVVGLTGVTAIAASESNGYALKADGTVWAWGDNRFAGTGSGAKLATHTTPVRVYGLAGVTGIAASRHTGYAVAGGEVWAWGDNTDGALGNGAVGGWSLAPVKVAGLTDVTEIAAGERTRYALVEDGSVWSWGGNDSAQLGGFAGARSAEPVRIAGVVGAVSVAGGADAGYAVLADKTVLAWGANDAGQLGSGGTSAEESIPVAVTGLTGVARVVGGGEGAYALRADGTVWAWGGNRFGEVGDGTTDPAHTAKPVAGLAGVKAVAATATSAYAVS